MRYCWVQVRCKSKINGRRLMVSSVNELKRRESSCIVSYRLCAFIRLREQPSTLRHVFSTSRLFCLPHLVDFFPAKASFSPSRRHNNVFSLTPLTSMDPPRRYVLIRPVPRNSSKAKQTQLRSFEIFQWLSYTSSTYSNSIR